MLMNIYIDPRIQDACWLCPRSQDGQDRRCCPQCMIILPSSYQDNVSPISIVPQRSCHQVASAWFEGCCRFEADQEGIVLILQLARTITKIWNIGRERLLSLFGSRTPRQLRGWQHLFIDSCTRWRVWWCAQPMGYQLLRAHSSREGVLPWPREDQKVL